MVAAMDRDVVAQVRAKRGLALWGLDAERIRAEASKETPRS
jgi:hypothetical protein